MNIPHPIPYQGSKRNLADEILRYFPATVETLHEPFAGSAAISLAAATQKKVRRFHINDLNKPLGGGNRKVQHSGNRKVQHSLAG
ncbi:MAG: DNA adenine methylase [Candidatus Thermoplasmatota archaeon]|nr:DNA adenine methylase [Candidatus Thermoplasmatota archaeon]